MENQLSKGQNIFFEGESLPMTVRALNENYAVCTRKFDKKEDSDIVKHALRTSAYHSKASAEKAYKDDFVYSILDFKNKIKGTHNLIFNQYSFGKDEDMEKIIKDLERRYIEISHRNQSELNINWNETNDKPF